MTARKWVLAVVMVFGLVLPACAGWIMVEKDGNASLISKGRLRGSSEGTNWIFNGPKSEMTFFDDAKKLFWSGTPDAYCKEISAMIEQMMKDIPPEQRKMMEKEAQSSSQEVVVKQTDDVATLAGFKTSRYKVLVDGELFEEIWLTKDSALMKEYKPLIPLIQKHSACMGAFNTGFNPENSDEYRKIWENGFLLKSVKYALGHPETDTDVLKLEKGDLPDKEFETPAGYTKTTLSELWKSMME